MAHDITHRLWVKSLHNSRSGVPHVSHTVVKEMIEFLCTSPDSGGPRSGLSDTAVNKLAPEVQERLTMTNKLLLNNERRQEAAGGIKQRTTVHPMCAQNSAPLRL